MAIILDGKIVSSEIKKSVKDEIDRLNITPKLRIIKSSNDPAFESYIKDKVKDCSECGIECDIVHAEDIYDYSNIITEIIEAAHNTNGLIVQLPLKDSLKEYTKDIMHFIEESQDVGCFNPYNVYRLYSGKPIFTPCTPDGIFELLKYYNISVAGKHVVIVGRSDIVGKPLSVMMIQENATVTLCHSKTINLSEHTKTADILVSAVGKEKLITEDMVKESAIVIDVGINRNSEGKLCGDVDFENVKNKVYAITPVPGGIGLMTRAMLMKNVLKAYRLQNGIDYFYSHKFPEEE